jgi:hypothetical protein
MVPVQLPLAGENQRDGASASQLLSNVAPLESILLQQKTQHIGWLRLWNRVMLLLVAFNQQGHQLNGFFLIMCRIGLRCQLEESAGVLRKFLIRVNQPRRYLSNHLGWIG